MKIEDLTEMSIAAYGEWDADLAYTDITMGYMKNKYTHVGTIPTREGDFHIYKLSNFFEYVIGFFAETYDDNHEDIREKFKVSAEISLEKMPDFEHYHNILSVKAVKVVSKLRSRGIAPEIYKFFMAEGYTLMGGEEQYYGARLLWKNFSNATNHQVDIVDIKTNTILETDVKLHHGTEDYDFDHRGWAYTPEKKNIRLILTKR